jgi:hypothetical protein
MEKRGIPLVAASTGSSAFGSSPPRFWQEVHRAVIHQTVDGTHSQLSGLFEVTLCANRRSIFEKSVLRPRQAQILAQRRAFIFGAKQAAPLQLGHDAIAEIF